MNRKTAGLLAAAAMLLVAGAANAADIERPAVVVPMASQTSPAASGFDWSRYYGGVQGGVWYRLDPLIVDSFKGSAMLGRTAVLGDRLVVGGEIATGFYFSAPLGLSFDAMALARGGILLSDRMLAYGTVGVGYDFGAADDAFMVAGGGLELGLGAHLGLRSEVLAFRYLGEPFSYLSGTLGLSWYFGR